MVLRRFLLLLPLFWLSSCGIGDAEKIADDFHKKLDAGEYSFIVDNMIDSDALTVTPKEQWIMIFEGIREYYGKVIERSKDTGFESNYNDGITTVKFDYTITGENHTYYERIYLVDRGDGFKISGILYNQDFSELERQSENF